MNDQVQNLGLKAINLMARGSSYRLQQHRYGKDDRHQYDCYLHNDQIDNRPNIIFLYGGNWRSGARADYRFVADTLCLQGFNVYIPDYRLYPHVRFFEILEDVRTAINSIMDNIKPGPIFIMGHSAGAQIGALMALDTRLLNDVQRISGFIGLAGPYDFYPFTEDAHWDLFSPEEQYPNSQPVNFVRADAPPLYLLHGEDDNRVRRGHSKSLMEKQREVGGHAQREVYSKQGHVDILLSLTRLQRQKSKVLKDIRQFILDHSMQDEINELAQGHIL
jgi:acetyl esterase/lipase